MIGKAIVLLFLEHLIVERTRALLNLLGIRTKQKVDEGCIVKDTMHIGAHTFVVHEIAIRTTIGKMEQWRGLGITKRTCLTHMDLVAHSKLTHHLAGALLTTHSSGRWQKTKARESLNIALHMIRVAHLDAHHLITATDAQNGSPFTMGSNNGLGTAITTKFVEIIER